MPRCGETIEQAAIRVMDRTLEIQQRPEAQTSRERLRNHDDLFWNGEYADRVARRALDVLYRRHSVGVTDADLIIQRMIQDPLYSFAVLMPRMMHDIMQDRQRQESSRLAQRISSLGV